MDPKRQIPAEPDKDRYTYDEMMERLRGQRSSGGSRRVKIEAPDGTVEVKKRKRRTHQPIKERRQRIGQLKRNLLLVGIPVILLLIGLYLLLNVRYQSESFRSSLSKSVTELVGAKTEVAPLNIKGLDVASRRLFIETNAGALLQDAEFTSLTGRLATSSLLSSDWHLTHLDALHGKLRFSAPIGPLSGRPSLSSISGTIPITAAGLGFSSKPSAFHIDAVRVGSADFSWTTGLKEFVFLEDTAITSNLVGARTDMLISGGKLRFGDWPEFDLETAKVDFTKNEIRVEQALLRHHFIGSSACDATLSGIIDLSGPSPLADFVCVFDSMPAVSLVDPVWKGKLEGDIDASFSFKADLAKPGSLVVSGPFSIRSGSFGDINPTKRLAVFLTEPNISRVKFHSINGKITIAEGRRWVEDLEANAPSLLRVTGGYQIESDGELKGSLNLSISNKILDEFPGGMPACFTKIDNDWSSTPVEISGTTSDPTEDLTERLQQALEKHERESAAPPASSYPTIPLSPDSERTKVKPPKE